MAALYFGAAGEAVKAFPSSCERCHGDPPVVWLRAYRNWMREVFTAEGAAVAFGLMGMAEAIRETYCHVCRECGYVAHNERPCQCWNDE